MDTHDTAEQRLADAVRARRLLTGATQSELAKVAGVSDTTWNTLERAMPVSERTLVKVSRALGWTPDSAQRILDGAEPEDDTSTSGPYDPGATARLEALEVRMGNLETQVRRLVEQLVATDQQHRSSSASV